MRLGIESRGKAIAAAVMAVLAVVLVVRMIVLNTSSSAAAPAARPQPESTRRPPERKATAAPATASLDPTLRLDLLQASEATEYEGSGRNIFRAYEPPPPAPSKIASKDPNSPENCVLLHPGCPNYVPPPPPITLKFFGFASRPGEAKKVFLADGDNIFVGKEGDVVNRRYKILKISANSVEVEDVLNNNRQVIFMTQGSGT